MRGFGIFCAICGSVFALLALNMDTSVPGGYGLERVNNMGLMADRQNYLMISIGAVIVGVLMVLFGNRSQETPQLANTLAPKSEAGLRACPFCAEPIKNEAIKCKHCGSAVEAVEIEQPKANAFFEKADDMSWGEYHEKFIEHYGIARVGDGFLWKGEKYQTMQTLVDAVRAMP